MQATSSRGSQDPDDGIPGVVSIYLAGHPDEYQLSSRIEVEGMRSGIRLHVWEDERFLSNGFWTEESDAAMRRSGVAVVRLSKRYLNSKYAEPELSALEKRSQISSLAILAILLEPCEWQSFEVLHKIQIWKSSSPLSELPHKEVEEELRRIVDAILRIARLPAKEVKPPVTPRFAFTRGAGGILIRAEQLAKQSTRRAVNCSCLLFGLVEATKDPGSLSMLVRQALSVKEGGYSAAFGRFLRDANTRVVGREIEGLTGRFTPNTLAVLTSAERIALTVGGGSKEIRTRHLFGALIAPLPQTHSAKKSIQEAGIVLPELVLEFLDFLKKSAPKDDLEKWREILLESPASSSQLEAPAQETPFGLNGPEPSEVTASRSEAPAPNSDHSRYVSGAPGYNAEFCGVGGHSKVSDDLGVKGLAGRLAELICLQETQLPLAIGLFGNWGSGKSHFMNLIDRRIKSLTQESRDAADSQSRWCREIVPIYFNAWHYSDSNLWASLVTEIFDALFAHIDPQKDEMALLRDRLREAGGVAALAEEQLKVANDSVLKAKRALDTAIADKKQAGRTLEALFAGLKTLIPDLNTPQNREQVVELLGVSPEDATLSELNAKRKELTSIAGRTTELWRRATNPKGLATRLGWLAGAAIAIGIIYVIGLHPGPIKTLLAWMGPSVRRALIILAGITAWMTPVFRQVQAGLSQLEKWQTRAEHAQTEMRADPRVVEAQNQKSQAEARAIAAQAALAAAKSDELSLTQAIDSLRPERRLGRFIETRARSADYRGQLGLVSLARRDFNELSRIFTDAESIKEELKGEPRQAQGLDRLSLRVDRVVLFIDDLDRCEPEKIVDVLQAVHLLLAYPLFAVIVGVDQRALRQSLRMRLKGLLAQNGEEMRASRAQSMPDETPATPLDYLEKIFHIPLHLPPMGKEGFETLVWNLSQPKEAAAGVNQSLKEDESEDSAPSGIADSVNVPSNMERADNRDSVVDVEGEPSSDEANAEPEPMVGSVPLCDWERNALKDYHSLIYTPRGATRFLNTYRLVRAGVPSTEWDRFRGDEGGLGEFRIPMLLLAVAAGQPSIARDWFTLMRERENGLPSPDEIPDLNKHAWFEFRKLYDETAKQMPMSLTPDLVSNWIGRVERFTF
jgi:hypothetical protein